MKSTVWSLNTRDWLRGLLMAVIVPVLTIISQSVNAGSLVVDAKSIIIAAISGGTAYILKQLLTDTNGAAVKTLDSAGVKQIDIPQAKEELKNKS